MSKSPLTIEPTVLPVLKPKQAPEEIVTCPNKKPASIQEVSEMFDKGYHCKEFLPSNTKPSLRLAENLTVICYYPLLSILYLWQGCTGRILARVGIKDKGFTKIWMREDRCWCKLCFQRIKSYLTFMGPFESKWCGAEVWLNLQSLQLTSYSSYTGQELTLHAFCIMVLNGFDLFCIRLNPCFRYYVSKVFDLFSKLFTFPDF